MQRLTAEGRQADEAEIARRFALLPLSTASYLSLLSFHFYDALILVFISRIPTLTQHLRHIYVVAVLSFTAQHSKAPYECSISVEPCVIVPIEYIM